MRTAQLLLAYLLMGCQTVNSLIDKWVKLGDNVTLDCPIGVKDMYWAFQKPTDSPVLILRTFSSESTSSRIQEERFRDKYSALTYSRLFISNITTNELGIYYCIKSDITSLNVSNGTRLHIKESAEDHNQTECNKPQLQPEKSAEIQKILTFISFLLNIVLIVAIIGWLIFKLKKSTKSQQRCQNVEPVQLEDLSNVEYSEIDLPTHPRRGSPNQINVNGTYVLLQKPKPQTR